MRRASRRLDIMSKKRYSNGNSDGLLLITSSWKNVLKLLLDGASQVAICALAVPISFSEAAWKLGERHPLTNLLRIFILSIQFLVFLHIQLQQ